MKYRLMAFFSGRNGMDALSNTLTWAAILLLVVNIVIPGQLAHTILYYLSLALLLYAYFRVFSRNIPKRKLENAAFTGFWIRRKLNFQQRKTHKFYGCPKCKATLRVPKGRGQITITCNCCGTQFKKKT